MSQSIKIVDITKKEITEEMLEQFASLDEAADDDPMNEVFDEEEADMHFARGSSNYSSDNSDKGSIGEGEAESELDGIADIDDRGSSKEETPLNHLAIQQGSFHFAASSFSFPPDSSSLHRWVYFRLDGECELLILVHVNSVLYIVSSQPFHSYWLSYIYNK